MAPSLALFRLSVPLWLSLHLRLVDRASSLRLQVLIGQRAYAYLGAYSLGYNENKPLVAQPAVLVLLVNSPSLASVYKEVKCSLRTMS